MVKLEYTIILFVCLFNYLYMFLIFSVVNKILFLIKLFITFKCSYKKKHQICAFICFIYCIYFIPHATPKFTAFLGSVKLIRKMRKKTNLKSVCKYYNYFEWVDFQSSICLPILISSRLQTKNKVWIECTFCECIWAELQKIV